MPGNYMAQNQSLFGVPGAPPAPRQPIDIGGAIDALTSGATSLIHGALLRKQAENEMAYRTAETNRANAQVGLEQQREAREAANQAFNQNLETTKSDRAFVTAGGIPARTTFDTTPNAMDVSQGLTTPAATLNAPASTTAAAPFTAPPVSAVARAMTSGAPIAAPAAAPTAAAAPSRLTTTPESFDPTRGAAYERGFMMADMRNQGYITREQAKGEIQAENQQAHDQRVAAMRTSAEKSAQVIANIRTQASGAKGAKSALLQSQAERGRLAAASDLITNAGGSVDEATDMLNNTAQGKMLRDQGVTPYHLMQAHSALVKEGTGQAVKMQLGANGLPADKAVDAVTGTRKLVGGKPATLTPLQPSDSPGGATTPAATPAPAKQSISKTEKDALVKRGFKEADILKKYTVSP